CLSPSGIGSKSSSGYSINSSWRSLDMVMTRSKSYLLIKLQSLIIPRIGGSDDDDGRRFVAQPASYNFAGKRL
ncbi:MAG: hypothetical protein ACOYN8_09925, partial [Pseudanabaena sp.]